MNVMFASTLLLLTASITQAPEPTEPPLAPLPSATVTEAPSDSAAPASQPLVDQTDSTDEAESPQPIEEIHAARRFPQGGMDGVQGDWTTQDWNWQFNEGRWFPSTRHPSTEYRFPRYPDHHPPHWHWHNWWWSSGDMTPHIAYYPTLHANYYARPYHPMTTVHHQQVARDRGEDYRHPYDNRIFEKVYAAMAAERLEAAGPEEPLDDEERQPEELTPPSP